MWITRADALECSVEVGVVDDIGILFPESDKLGVRASERVEVTYHHP